MAYQLIQEQTSKEVKEALSEITPLVDDASMTGFVFAGILRGRKYFVSITGSAYADPTLARGMIAALDDELSLMVHTRIDRSTTIV